MMYESPCTCGDFNSAKERWEKENPGSAWDSLRTKTKNLLAREEKFIRESRELFTLIKKHHD